MLTEIDKRLDKSIYLYIIQRLTTDNSKWIYIPLTKVWFRWATMVSYALTVLSPLELPCSEPRSPRRVLCAHLAVSLEITFFPTLISIPCIMYSCTVSLNTYHLCFVIIVSIDVRALCFVLTVLSPLTSALYAMYLNCCLPWCLCSMLCTYRVFSLDVRALCYTLTVLSPLTFASFVSSFWTTWMIPLEAIMSCLITEDLLRDPLNLYRYVISPRLKNYKSNWNIRNRWVLQSWFSYMYILSYQSDISWC